MAEVEPLGPVPHGEDPPLQPPPQPLQVPQVPQTQQAPQGPQGQQLVHLNWSYFNSRIFRKTQ